MKLNKKGWGFFEFFVFLIIFIICLFIAMYGLRKFGLLDEDYHFVKFENINKPKEEQEEKPKITHGLLREEMVGATIKYIKKYYDNNLGLDTLNIRVSQLQNEGLLEKFVDANGDKCSGYISVYLDEQNRIQYDPYLKCKGYETTGYESRKDG